MSIENKIIEECNCESRVKLCDECSFRNKIVTQQQKIDQLEREVEDLRSGKNTMVFGGRQIGKTYLQNLEKENKEMKDGLINVQKLCDNQNPSHENIWRYIEQVKCSIEELKTK